MLQTLRARDYAQLTQVVSLATHLTLTLIHLVNVRRAPISTPAGILAKGGQSLPLPFLSTPPLPSPLLPSLPSRSLHSALPSPLCPSFS